MNHGWLCTGEDVCQVCGFSERVDYTKIVRTGTSNFNKATK
jgi:hypothetical protein